MRKKTFYQLIGKRALDILLSGIALIILSPIILIVAILVKTKLGSPVIFKQERPGKNEKNFFLCINFEQWLMKEIRTEIIYQMMFA